MRGGAAGDRRIECSEPRARALESIDLVERATDDCLASALASTRPSAAMTAGAGVWHRGVAPSHLDRPFRAPRDCLPSRRFRVSAWRVHRRVREAVPRSGCVRAPRERGEARSLLARLCRPRSQSLRIASPGSLRWPPRTLAITSSASAWALTDRSTVGCGAPACDECHALLPMGISMARWLSTFLVDAERSPAEIVARTSPRGSGPIGDDTITRCAETLANPSDPSGPPQTPDLWPLRCRTSDAAG